MFFKPILIKPTMFLLPSSISAIVCFIVKRKSAPHWLGQFRAALWGYWSSLVLDKFFQLWKRTIMTSAGQIWICQSWESYLSRQIWIDSHTCPERHICPEHVHFVRGESAEVGIFTRRAMVDQARQGLCYQRET